MRQSISLITALIIVLVTSAIVPPPSLAQESAAQETAALETISQESTMPATKVVEEFSPPKKVTVASNQNAVQPPVRKFTKTKKILVAAAVVCLVAAAIAIPIAVGVHAHNRREHHIEAQKQQAHFIIQGEELKVARQLQSVESMLKQSNLTKPAALALFRQKSVLEAQQSALVAQDLSIFGRSFNVLRFKEGLGGLLYAR